MSHNISDEAYKNKLCTEIIHNMLQNHKDNYQHCSIEECIDAVLVQITWYNNMYGMIDPHTTCFGNVLNEMRDLSDADNINIMINFLCNKDETYIKSLQHILQKEYNSGMKIINITHIFHNKDPKAAHDFFSTLIGG